MRPCDCYYFTHLFRPTTIIHIPSKSGKLHGEDHLGSSNLHGFIAQSVKGANNVARRNQVSITTIPEAFTTYL